VPKAIEGEAKVPAEMKVSKGTVYVFEDSACLACFDANGMLVLIQQFREAHARQTVELPGGNVLPGESPFAAALREFEEETALSRPHSANLLFSLDLDLSTSRHRTHVFQAKVDLCYNEIRAQRGVKLISLPEALAGIKGGTITHAPTVAAILAQGRI